MIYAEINNLKNYYGLGRYLDEAISYLDSHPLEGIETGHYEINGKYLYMNVFEYETIAEEGAFFEAHEKYADIHIIMDGEENIGVSDISRVTVKTSDKESDLIEVAGKVEHYMKLIPGKALIALPEDAHMVKLSPRQPSTVKKAVLKVYMDGGSKGI
ncbi:DUF386 domain-containing protein [Lachnospiraceae bacterium]|nr:DUF386 domain-containing protein [Lachnospiraceae bacterium]